MSQLAILVLSASALLGQSTEEVRTANVYGKVVDAFDGLPLPGLDV